MLETLRQSLSAETGENNLRISPRKPLDFQSNRLFDVWAGGRHFIAKEYLKPEEYDTAPINEYQALSLLTPLDIAPQPILLLPPAYPTGPIVLYEYLAGEMWDRYRPDAAELARLADIWIKLHSLPVEGLWLSRGAEPARGYLARSHRSIINYNEWVEVEFRPGRQAVDLILSLLEKCRVIANELDEYNPTFRFCRADNRFANFIRRPDGRLGIVDWEDSGLRDPAVDMADLFTHANQEDLLSFEDWQAFAGPYMEGVIRPDPTLHWRVHLHLLIHNFFWLSILLSDGLRRFANSDIVGDRDDNASRQVAGGLAGWHVNQMPANQRLRRYLARAQAWPVMTFTAQLEQLANIRFFPT